MVSRDGTRLDGSNPTILYGYGGFEVSMTPGYNATTGSSWLEKGGVYALANIRGGGEFGPEWHTTALREGRQKAHDDFIAVAEDLVRRGLTGRPEGLKGRPADQQEHGKNNQDRIGQRPGGEQPEDGLVGPLRREGWVRFELVDGLDGVERAFGDVGQSFFKMFDGSHEILQF